MLILLAALQVCSLDTRGAGVTRLCGRVGPAGAGERGRTASSVTAHLLQGEANNREARMVQGTSWPQGSGVRV